MSTPPRPRRRSGAAARRLGADRERQVARVLREAGWSAWTTKNTGQADDGLKTVHGLVDVVAVHRVPGTDVCEVRLIQVKTTAQPFKTFGREEREALRREADAVGAIAELWHWPPRARAPRVLLPADWP